MIIYYRNQIKQLSSLILILKFANCGVNLAIVKSTTINPRGPARLLFQIFDNITNQTMD